MLFNSKKNHINAYGFFLYYFLIYGSKKLIGIFFNIILPEPSGRKNDPFRFFFFFFNKLHFLKSGKI